MDAPTIIAKEQNFMRVWRELLSVSTVKRLQIPSGVFGQTCGMNANANNQNLNDNRSRRELLPCFYSPHKRDLRRSVETPP